MRISNDGTVRIGDGSVNAAGVGAGPALSITGAAPEITLRDSATGTPYAWMATNDAGSLVLSADQGNNAGSSIIDFRVDGTERIRIGASGQIGIAGANFGTSGQVLTSKGSGASVAWEDVSSGGITTTAYSPPANAIIQIGLGTAQHHELTLSAGITTVTTTGGAFGESHSLVLIQPSSGICTVGFSTFFKFPSGSTPEMSEGGSKVDLVSFVVKNIARNVGTGATELLASAGLNYS